MRNEHAGKLALSQGDQMGYAHLEVRCHNNTSPENPHHMSCLDATIAHQLCAEPETLYKHSHCDKLIEARAECSNAIDPPYSASQLLCY